VRTEKVNSFKERERRLVDGCRVLVLSLTATCHPRRLSFPVMRIAVINCGCGGGWLCSGFVHISPPVMHSSTLFRDWPIHLSAHWELQPLTEHRPTSSSLKSGGIVEEAAGGLKFGKSCLWVQRLQGREPDGIFHWFRQFNDLAPRIHHRRPPFFIFNPHYSLALLAEDATRRYSRLGWIWSVFRHTATHSGPLEPAGH